MNKHWRCQAPASANKGKHKVSSIPIIQYFYKLFLAYSTYYLTYGFNMFRDYPLEVQVSVLVSELSIVLIVIMLIALLYAAFGERRNKKLLQHIRDKYGDGIEYLLSGDAPEHMSKESVAELFGIDRKELGKPVLKSRREKGAFTEIFYKSFITRRSGHIKKENLRTALYLFGIPEFLEREVSLRGMKHKVNAMNIMRIFKLPVSPWVLNKLLNSKYLRVQRTAMYVQIALSSDSDLDYFETDFFDKHCCIKDEIELAYSLQRRRKAGLKLPNLARWANMQKNEQAQCLFVRLMRRFDEGVYCEQLRPLFSQTRKKKLIEEISRTWGYLHYVDGEDLLIETLLTQPDDTKVAIMHALTRFATGKGIDALLEGYRNTTNPHVRFEALRCLYNYGDEGRALFRKLEQEATEADQRFFGFFNNPITLEKIRLDREQAYHPSVETVLND